MVQYYVLMKMIEIERNKRIEHHRLQTSKVKPTSETLPPKEKKEDKKKKKCVWRVSLFFQFIPILDCPYL